MRLASPTRPRLIRARTVGVSQRRRCEAPQGDQCCGHEDYHSLLHHSPPFLFSKTKTGPPLSYEVAGCAAGAVRPLSAHLRSALPSLYCFGLLSLSLKGNNDSKSQGAKQLRQLGLLWGIAPPLYPVVAKVI